MATKLQLITAMYEHELNQMTSKPGEWQRFLLAAGRNYRLSFEEQVQVFVQRPDATAVLELEKWNKTFNRWVNKGATGIAVVDRASLDRRRLKYYFDISDTSESEYRAALPVPIWEVRPDYHADVIETLEATFGDLEDSATLARAIISAAHNAVPDNMTDYLSDLMNCREDSFLEELDDLNVEVFLREALQNSVAYLWLARCGIDTADYFEPEDFRRVYDFNTPDTLMVLGTAASDIAETGLREISSTVLNLQRREQNQNRTFADRRNIRDNSNVSNTERSIDHDTDNTAHNLHRGERVQDTRPDAAGRTRSRAWQIRPNAPSLPDEPQKIPVQPSADERRAEPAPVGNRADGAGAHGLDGIADGGGAGRDGAVESPKSDGMGRQNEQHPAQRGGNDSARTDLRLNLPTPEEQQKTIAEAEGTAQKPTPSAFSMLVPQEIVDFEFTRFEGAYNQRLRIFYWFDSLHTEDEAAKFLKNEFGTGGHTALNGFDYGVSYDSKGMTFTKGSSLMPSAKHTLSWNKAAKRVQELIAADRFLTAADKEIFYPQYLEYLEHREEIRQKNAALDAALSLPIEERRSTLAPRIADFLNGLNEDARYLNDKLTENGLPEIADTTNAEQIEAILADPQQAEKLLNAMRAIAGASSGVFERNHGYRFREELAALHERRMVYHLGDTVYIGAHEYEVLAFDENTVRLYDTQFPLFNEEMPRAEFDRKIAENPQNEHLLAVVTEPKPEIAAVKLLEETAESGAGRTDYYLFYLPDGSDDPAALSHDTLSLIKEKSDFYVICADVCYLSESQMAEWNVAFRKMPRDWNLLPTEVKDKIRAIKPEYERHWLEQNGWDVFDEYSAVVVSKILFDEAYTNARANSDEQNARTECEAAVERVALEIGMENMDFLRAYSDEPWFKPELVAHVFQKTYTDFLKDPTAKTDPQAALSQLELIRNDLTERGFAVSDELILDGINEYGKLGDYQDIADYIENEYLSEEPEEPYIPEIGDRYAIDGRIFEVDDVLLDSDAVSLRDVTFADNAGFPIFRKESLDFIRLYDPIREIPDKQPGFEDWSEPATERNAPEYPGEPSDDVSAYLPPQVVSREVHHGPLFDVEFVKLRFPEPEEQEPWYRVGDTVFSAGTPYEVISVADNGAATLRDENGALQERDPAALDAWLYTNDLNKQLRDRNNPRIPEPTITPSWEQKKKPACVNYFDAFPDTPMSQRHNFRITDDNLGHGGAKAKFRANMDAINLLHDLELDRRLATPEEQEILSRYVGWGSLADAFKENNPGWENEYLELKATLSPEEYESARATTLNAHYTSPTVIKAIYKAVENMGFRTGNVLDPGCGIGNFQGLLPDSMSDSKVYGIEIDPITGRIAQQLYQRNSIQIAGYEKTALPDSFFDLAIGNVPFGGYGVSDKKYDKHKFHIHDYFFAKTLDKVRPGGVVAFITSSWTMDKQNSAVRKYIAQRAELLGAIRLPNNAFKANAGTDVTTDILFLQKRDRIIDVEPDWVHLGKTDEGFAVNSYFIDHPDMILGTMSNDSGVRMYASENSLTCMPFPDRDLADLLDEAIQNIHGEIADFERDEDEQDADNSIPADPTVRNFSFTVVDGQIYYRENSRMYPKELSATGQSRVKGMVEIRESVRRLIAYQTEDYPGSDIRAEQANLNRMYDSYTCKYGILNDRANNMAFSDDESYPLLCSLEVLDDNLRFKAKADMFSKRTINPHRPITHVDTASEALAVSIGERARVDLGFMVDLTGKEPQTILKELEGIVFQLPKDGEPVWVTADEYLSGNIREKLETARAYAAENPEFALNVQALEAVQPKDLTAPEISVRLGATWIPPEVYQQFVFELLNTNWRGQNRIKVLYSPHTAEWSVTEKTCDRENFKTYNTYGTKRMNAYQIIEQTLNLRTVRVFDTVYGADGKENKVLNKRDTAIAQDKQDIIKAQFAEWIWKDPTRRERLCRIYNDRFNSIRPREYDGQHIKFHGMSPEIKLDKHQINAAARRLYGGNSLFGHVVGAGKSYEMIAAGMEAKRLGLCNKPMHVVPNNIIADFASDFFKLYPSANVLMATAKDFEKKNRRKFCARIATGDYDGIIIAHSQFEKIPMSIERQINSLERQIWDIQAGIEEIKRQKGENFTIKQMERSKKSLQVKLDKLNDQSRKDSLVTFEELGVDALFVDEADLFKNLYLVTKMRNVGGIAQTESQKASDLFMKTRYLDEITGNRGVVFATGTPVSNSLAEVYTMQRYLQYDTLVEHGLQHFDCWASTFGETVTAMELTPEGKGFQMKTRFSSFYNLPELMAMFKEVADIQTKDMLNLPTPKVNFNTVVSKPSEMQREMIAGLAERADRIRRREVDSKEDNMLLITNDGRKIALDQRIVNPLLPDHPESKVNSCVDNVFRIWEENKEKRLTQLVFSDLSTPHGNAPIEMTEVDGVWIMAEAPQFTNVYDDIKRKLIAKGVPAEEIAYIHDAKNERQKKEIVAKVRSGTIRVLLGSTSKMGAGMNAQDKIIASHDLDCPWRPRDLEQRLGRTERRGNTNPEVYVYRYVTEGTFDAYCYQLIENKQRGIAQVFTSKSPARIMLEVDEVALNYAEIKALATGNPLIIERCSLEAELNKLKTLKSSHLSQRYELEDKIFKTYPAEIKRLTERIAGYEHDISVVTANPKAQGDDFVGMTIGGRPLTDKKAAGTAILEACKAMTNPEAVPLGEYRGFAMDLFFNSFSKEYCVTLKGQLSYAVSLGDNLHGNITRLDNALDGMDTKLADTRDQLQSVNTQLESANAEIQTPFAREQELADKTTRLAELTIALKLDEKDHEILDDAPDEGDAAEQPRKKERSYAR